MVSEIRVLEDQLYAADYENQVLRDRIDLLESRVDSGSAKVLEPSNPNQSPKPSVAPKPREAEPVELPDLPLDDFNMEVEEGQLSDPNALDDPNALTDPGTLSDGLPDLPSLPEGDPFMDDAKAPETDAPDANTPDANTPETGGARLLPPPGGPEPPGTRDLQLPEVSEGEIIPPPAGAKAEDQDSPGGQIILPESIQSRGASVPESIRIHQGLSGKHQFDEEPAEGIFVVINAIDRKGRMVDLSQFDIEADLTVVAVDPSDQAPAEPLGRWEFSSNQVKSFVRQSPASGFHIPLRWQETKPMGDEVVLHVRLRAEDDEMRCEGRLKLTDKTNVADWTPRAESVLVR